MGVVVWKIILFVGIFRQTLQICPEETSTEGISITWHQSTIADNVGSDPLCYINETLITRNCTKSDWIPPLNELKPCQKVVKYFDVNSCPPGYHQLDENSNDYCYHVTDPSPWNYPCFTSGGSSVITDLSSIEITYLLNSLKALNTSRYFWIPAQRLKFFNPVVWTIPGPNWGQRVEPSSRLSISGVFSKNCLILDIQHRILLTDVCTKRYPSLCFFKNDLYYTASCPNGYHSFRFTADKGACYGIATSDTPQGFSFNDFLNKTCIKPMSDTKDLSRFVFSKIAELNKLPDDVWCWFNAPSYRKSLNVVLSSDNQRLEGIINNAGVLGFMNFNYSLPCMACEAEIIYRKTELMFEYSNDQNLIYLTVYYPSGLWKYNENDKGIQCFSDAKGFVGVININDTPLIEINSIQQDSEQGQIEKIVYMIDLVTDSSAQYWCEGHTVNFSLIATEKIVVNPKGNKIHVFSLVLKYYILTEQVDSLTDLSDLVANITVIFDARKVLLMDILNYTLDQMLVLLHLHIEIDEEDKANILQDTFYTLKSMAELNFIKYNYTFVNMSSSMYCLPTTSVDGIRLDWELTHIGHISAPKQFCLQTNGLPVKRRCEGSYKLGAVWSKVEGSCDSTYKPSITTAFLYNFLKRPNMNVSEFLTEGLSFVLGDTDIIIPADIYYLSMSLQQISEIAQENVTYINTTDIEHIAWVMDRVMVLDCEYLRLAQTLNSTNVIVDSISEIIETMAKSSSNKTELSNIDYQLAVEPQFMVQVTHSDSNNITGIAIINDSSSNSFTDIIIKPLYKNTSLEDVISIENLEIAAWLPTEVLDSIKLLATSNNSEIENNKELNVIITVYNNDAVFQELNQYEHMVLGRIIGISIPEYFSNLEYPVPIIFKQINKTLGSFCGYWDFQPKQVNHVPGSWKKQGCYTVKSTNDTKVCECYHLTHFGLLFTSPNNEKENMTPSSGHALALNVITMVGSFLSLLGITGIWITALTFGNWRKKAGTKVLLQLSTAISLPLVIIVIFNLDYSMFVKTNDMYVISQNMKIRCIVLGAILHFSILASFMWMLITAVLQFVRYVRVLGVRRPARFMFKFSLIGWGIPLLPVAISLGLDVDNYLPTASTIRKICYPSGYYLIAGVLVPISIILLTNIILFILVLHAISKGSDQRTKSTDMDLVGAQFRVSVFLFFLLGLTWIFGIFSFSNHLLWSYLFCLTSTIQGFVLFVYFIICDPNTRGSWVTLMKPQFTTNSSRNSVTSISTG